MAKKDFYLHRGFGICCFIHNPEIAHLFPIPEESRTHLHAVFDSVEEAEREIEDCIENWYNDQDEKEYTYAIVPTITVKRNYGYRSNK